MNFTEQASRIANVLDNMNPGWYKTVDRDKLDMGDNCRCLLGQLYGMYSHGLSALGITRHDSVYYGVDVPDVYGEDGPAVLELEYNKLSEAIVGEINDRLAFDSEVEALERTEAVTMTA